MEIPCCRENMKCQNPLADLIGFDWKDYIYHILLKSEKNIVTSWIHFWGLEDTWSVFVGFWKGQCQYLWNFHEIHISTKRSIDPFVLFTLKDWLDTPISFSNILNRFGRSTYKTLNDLLPPSDKLKPRKTGRVLTLSKVLRAESLLSHHCWDLRLSQVYLLTPKPCLSPLVVPTLSPRSRFFSPLVPQIKPGYEGEHLVNDSLQSQMSHKKHQKET